jgi:hypothetical protein
MLTWNADTKEEMYYTQYHMYIRAKVTELAQVFHADNVFFSGYYGGGGVIPYGFSDAGSVNYYANEIPNPLNPSVYISLEPYAGRPAEDVISATGYKRDVWGVASAGLANADVPDFYNHAYFNLLYGFQERALNDITAETAVLENSNFTPGSSAVIAFRGPTGYWNKLDSDFTLFSQPTGFFPLRMYGRGFLQMLKGATTATPNYEYKVLVKKG